MTPASAATALFWEGCLSVQGYRGLVRRFLAVRVEGLGADGAPVDFVAKGWQARIAQHEMDHLNGVLYVDRMDTRTFRRVDKLDEPLPGLLQLNAPPEPLPEGWEEHFDEESGYPYYVGPGGESQWDRPS